MQAASSISLFLSLLLMRKILFPIAGQLASTRCTLKWNDDKPMTSIAEESKIPFRVYGNYLPRIIFMESEEVILQVCSVEYTSWAAGGADSPRMKVFGPQLHSTSVREGSTTIFVLQCYHLSTYTCVSVFLCVCAGRQPLCWETKPAFSCLSSVLFLE